MLSSILLSLAVTTSPAPVADTHTLTVENVARKRGDIKLNIQKLTINEIARKRGDIRLSAQKSIVQKMARKHRDVKL